MKAAVPIARIFRVAICWALLTLAWCAFVIVLAGRLMAQTPEMCPHGTYQIDRFGQLCISGTREIFAEEAHDGYTQWTQPHRPGTSCCNNQDCSPVQARRDEQRGVYQAWIDGQWRDIPAHIVLDPRKPENHNPDGSFHACWNRSTGELLCFREAEPKI